MERSTFDGRCSVPSDWVAESALAGQINHLGTVTAVGDHCEQFDFAILEATFGEGAFEITAANGDELWATYGDGIAGPLSETVFWLRFSYAFDRGTGRFADASGGGVARGMVNVETGDVSFEMDGAITYDASDRRIR